MDTKIKTRKITYSKLAEILTKLQVEFYCLSEEMQNKNKSVTASMQTTDTSNMMVFDSEDFSLFIGIKEKEVQHG